ncbi:MAG TPA: DUF2254 family protein [Aldersonia sp.]
MNVRVWRRRTRAGLSQGSAVFIGAALGFGLTRIPSGPMIPTSSVTPMLLGVAVALLGTIAVVFSVLFLVVQWVATTFTPRLTLFRDAPIVWRTSGMAIGVIIFCITAALAAGGEPHVSVAVPTVATVLILVLLAMLRSMHAQAFVAIQLSPVLASIAAHGRAILTATYEIDGASSAPAIDDDSLPPKQVVVTWADPPAVLQRLHVHRLVRAARSAGAVIVVRVSGGTTVHEDMPIATVHGAGMDPATVRAGFVTGPERTFEQDPLLAFRLLADIGLRALSPAVNDPATAVQALDEIEYLMARGMATSGRPREFADDDGVVRLVVGRPGWPEFLAAGVDDVMVAALPSPMVLSRLEILLTRLRDRALTRDQRASLTRRLDWVRSERAMRFPALLGPP